MRKSINTILTVILLLILIMPNAFADGDHAGPRTQSSYSNTSIETIMIITTQ